MAAPRQLTARGIGDGAVALDWEAYAGASRVLVERSASVPTAYELVADIAGDLATWIDDAPPAGGNYYRIRVLVDGALSPYSNEVLTTVSASEAVPPTVSPRLRRNPVKGLLEVEGLRAPVDQAFVSDAAGRTLLELDGPHARWQLRPGALPRGRYWIVLFSGYEWFSVPFEYRP